MDLVMLVVFVVGVLAGGAFYHLYQQLLFAALYVRALYEQRQSRRLARRLKRERQLPVDVTNYIEEDEDEYEDEDLYP